jgi:hypothetical protein
MHSQIDYTVRCVLFKPIQFSIPVMKNEQKGQEPQGAQNFGLQFKFNGDIVLNIYIGPTPIATLCLIQQRPFDINYIY